MASMPLLSAGAQAPEFSATAHDGSAVSLRQYAGKHVLLWFYPKADTPG
jgi:peroxiredoxin Q/BCP